MPRRCAAALLCALAACGGSTPRDAASPTSRSPSPSPASSSRPASVAPGTGTPVDRPVTTIATASSTGGAAPGTRVSAVVDTSCVRRGVDTQGLTVRNARANGYVGYSTEYSDHSNEVTNRSYTTGFGYGTVGPNGGYRATWVVPGNAPTGVATLRVAYSGSNPPIVLSFVVAAQDGSC